ncbi:MAG: thioredoxin family protein [Saprospiraceae bacterium]|nr:thioredoxin family protein [Saprospiraceae bacterium]
MKKIFSTAIALLFLFKIGEAQILNPVKWSFESKKINETEYDLIATAKLDKGWFIYSQFLNGDGPVPTALTFKPTPQYQLIGKAAEVSDHKKSGFDKIFEMNITKFSDEVKFVQRVKVTGSTDIKGSVEWQTCDDEKCLPPNSQDFNYKIVVGASASGGAAAPIPTNTPSPTQTTPSVLPTQTGTSTTATTSNQVPTNGGLVANSGGIQNPVKWTFESKKKSETEYDLVFKANLDKDWHIYSQFLKGDVPIPTSFKFEKNDNIELVGKLKEESTKRRQHKEPVFDNMEVIDFSETATFTQSIKIKDITKPINGSLEFQACNNEMCLPPNEIKFFYDIAKGTAGEIADNTIASTTQTTNTSGILTEPSQFQFDKTNETVDCTTEGVKADDTQSSLWWIFALGFGGGLLALLTPCVFPMIPLTVSFFTKGSKDRATGIRNALIYSLSIIVLYVSMGLLITTIFGSDALNRLSTNPWVNIAFGVLFLVFAVSFFGYFEITLPSSWTNKADEASNRGGLIGIFFMAFTLALVSFSCTGPIIGTLLVQTATSTGFSAGPAIGMLGFATALALPFGLFALFPAWLQSLPKSGSWMDDVKVTLGFIEVALAFKFLSNADLIKGWKYLPYEAFLAIWIVCALGLALYHAGILKFKYGGKKKFSIPRGAVVALSLAFAAYLGLGFRYNATTETFQTPEMGSGILPPAGYSYIYPQKCPLNLSCFHDLNEGIAEARKQNKPILLDFTGWNCANCRKMEENVWNKPGVMELIRDKYILVSLYTDDKKELHAPYAPYTSKFDGKLKDTEGEMWTDLEATFFNKNSQPFYVLVSAKEPILKVLNAPTAYTPEVEKYKAFLECGLR